MSVVTGLALGLLTMVVGALSMTLFGAYLANREKPRPVPPEAPVFLARADALQMIELIENLQPMRKKLTMLIGDHTTR
jgi:hypothetical protein